MSDVLAQLYPSMHPPTPAAPATGEQRIATAVDAVTDDALKAFYPTMHKPAPMPVAGDGEAAFLARQYPTMPPAPPEDQAPKPDPVLQQLYPTMFKDPLPAEADGSDAPSSDVVAALGDYAVPLPDGWKTDAAALTEARDLFKGLGLTGEQGRKVLGHYVELQLRQAEAAIANAEGWRRTIRADPELGGARWDDSVRYIEGVMKRFGTPELSRVLKDTGYGDHPDLVRLVVRMSRALEGAERGAKR